MSTTPRRARHDAVRKSGRSIPTMVWILGLVAAAIALTVGLNRGRNDQQNLASSAETNRPASAPPATNVDLTPIVPENLDTNDPVQLYNMATELLHRDYVMDAIPLYEQAARLKPEDETIYFSLGRAYTRIGATNQALKNYQRALEIFPDYPEVHNNLGNLFLGQRKYAEAVQHYTAALQVLPEYPSALNNLGKCLAAQGRIEEAITHFTSAARLEPDYLEAHYNLAVAYAGLRRHDEAIAHYVKVLQLEPSFEPAQRGLELVRAAKRRAQ